MHSFGEIGLVSPPRSVPELGGVAHRMPKDPLVVPDLNVGGSRTVNLWGHARCATDAFGFCREVT